MKKFFLLCLFVCIGFVLISWGTLGHHVVGEIAENHLTPEAKAGVKELLGHQTLADVSSWADDIRQDNPETGSWHFLNLPLGLSFADFAKQVQTMPTGNVYNSILRCIHDLKDNNLSQRKKVEALKFLVHFVGDAHQPMHVSRAEDKGGNTIMLTYNNEYTNLHSIWDSKLLEQDRSDYKTLATKYDKANQAQVAKWQNDPVIMWVWESYQISSILYAEVDNSQGKTLGKEYYERHIPVVENRLEKAGIRLAGVLNAIYKK